MLRIASKTFGLLPNFSLSSILSLCVYIIFLSSPSELGTPDFRGLLKGMTLSFDEHSPPLAVLNDIDVISKNLEGFFKPGIKVHIDAQTNDSETEELVDSAPLLIVESEASPIASEIKRVVLKDDISTIREPAVLDLEGLTLDKKDPNIKSLVGRIQSRSPHTTRIAKFDSNEIQDLPPKKSVKDWIDSSEFKSRTAKLRALSTKNIESIINEKYEITAPTLKERFEKAVEENSNNNNRVVSLFNGKVKVAAPPSKNSEKNRSASNKNSLDHNSSKAENNDKYSIIAYNNDSNIPKNERKPSNSTSALVNTEDKTIVGHIEITGGLAFLGGEMSLSIYHEIAGELISEGQVDLQTANYKIELAENIGALIAELRTEQGELIGYSEKSISDIHNRNSTMVIEPLDHKLATYVYSGDSFIGAEKPIADVAVSLGEAPSYTDYMGQTNFENIDPKSQIEIRAAKIGYWPTRYIGKPVNKASILLYPEKMLNLITSVIGVEEISVNSGVIWGIAEHGEKPIENVKVQLSGKDYIGPIYFNDFYIPDLNLEKTSKNGLFAFINVNAGIYTIGTYFKNGVIDQQVLQVKEKEVTQVGIQTSEFHTSEFYSFDFESGKPLETQISILGSKDQINTSNGYAQYVHRNESNLFTVIGRPDRSSEYWPITRVFSNSDTQMNMPMIPRKITMDVDSYLRVNQSLSHGSLLGEFRSEVKDVKVVTTRGESLEIYFIKLNENPSNKFNGDPGTSFYVPNLKQGLYMVRVLFKDGTYMSKMIYSLEKHLSFVDFKKTNLK